MQKLKIDVTKIDKTALFKGEKGIYLDVTLLENRDGPDRYGNDGFIVQEISRERRDAGEKGPIIGNWKHAGQGAGRTVMPKPTTQPAKNDSSWIEDDTPPF